MMLARIPTAMQVTNPTGVDRLPEMEKEIVRDGNAELTNHRDSLHWSKIANAIQSGKTHSCIVQLLALPSLRLKFRDQHV
ncbi:MAG: hypothetical protein ACKPKO_26745, partial [Candidatus Fonsibacter sp.]